MKKLILISILLFSFNGWAECDVDDPTIVYINCLEKQSNEYNGPNNRMGSISFENNKLVEQVEKFYGGSKFNKAMAMGSYKNELRYSVCTNMSSIKRAKDCVLKKCKNCKVVAENNNVKFNLIEQIGRDIGWNNQPRSTNNQSEQMQIIELCLQRQADLRANAPCSVPPTKQGGIFGLAQQVNACRAQAAQMYPDDVCFGAPRPRYEAPQQNNSVQLCNFKCWGGQIVQGDCNTPAVEVNGGTCYRM